MKKNSFLKNISTGAINKLVSLWKNPYSKVNLNMIYIKYLKHIPADKIHSHKLLNHSTFFYGGPEYLHGLSEIFMMTFTISNFLKTLIFLIVALILV